MDRALTLAHRVSRAAERRGALKTLLLDVDGTLAPIAPTPEQAEIPATTLAALRCLVATGWTVALVSGRPAREVRGMAPVSGIRIFGSHGLEGSWSDGGAALAGRIPQRRISELDREARSLSAEFPGVLVERKPYGLAVHDRLLAPRLRAPFRRRLRRWVTETELDGFELLRGRRVLEIRPNQVHKGRVAETLPRLARRTGRDDSLVAMGDDRTDEDLFRAVGPKGLTVRIGRPVKRTSARLRLASPAAVGRFLRFLAGD